MPVLNTRLKNMKSKIYMFSYSGWTPLTRVPEANAVMYLVKVKPELFTRITNERCSYTYSDYKIEFTTRLPWKTKIGEN